MRAMTLDFDTKTTMSLESQMQFLALEASAISNVIETFSSIIPNLADSIFTGFKSLTQSDDIVRIKVQDAKLTFGKLKVKLPHASFIAQSKTLVSVPEGFVGNLLAYSLTLSNMSNAVFSEANKTLGEYNFVLSAFISNKENKISLKDHTDLFIRTRARREELSGLIQAFFPKDSDVSKAYLGDVIHRFNDLEPLVHSVERLNNQRKDHNLIAVNDSVKKCLDLLNIIINDTKNNGIAQVSGAAAQNISQGAYEVGKLVEFISVYRYRVEQLVSTIEKLLKSLEENI